jgi:hypothetical protein
VTGLRRTGRRCRRLLFRLPLPLFLRPPGRALSQQLFGLLASLVIGNARLAVIQIAAHHGVKIRPLMRPLMDREAADLQRWFRIWASSTAICTTVVRIRSSSLPDAIQVRERRAALRARDRSFPDLAPLNRHWLLDPPLPRHSASDLSTAPRMIIVLVSFACPA